MTVKIEVYVSIGLSGYSKKDILEFGLDDNLTQEELKKEKEIIAEEWMYENIVWNWWDVE